MNSSTPLPVPDLVTQWNNARRLYPVYFELAREFAIEVKICSDLEAGAETPGKDSVEQANRWLEELDERVQVHQLRQFLQTSALATPESLLNMVQHFLAKQTKTENMRDKIDFLLVQYFSQMAPAGLDDAEVDLAYVSQTLQPILGQVDLKTPVWLNALDRVLESARRCKSLDELLHGGILEQGRKAKAQAGDLFYLPVALVAFTRFGYLMRRAFFRLMLGDLNLIVDGLTELEEKGIKTLDCRRAQFSAQEPILRLRMICQSWKVMFQAEYSSGQPLRMLVDLRASVDDALGRGKAASGQATTGQATTGPAKPAPAKAAPAKAEVSAKPAAAPAKPGVALRTPAAKAAAASPAATKPVVAKPAPVAKAAAAAASAGGATSVAKAAPAPAPTPAAEPDETPEFEISNTPGWEPDEPAPSPHKAQAKPAQSKTPPPKKKG
jgi:hypothetical protein